MSEFSAWSRLPVDLQHQYFEHAREEYLKCKGRLLEQVSKLREYQRILPFKSLPRGNSWDGWRIVGIDGSFSPALSERVGARFGVYQAGCMVFQGADLCDERYTSGVLVHEQLGDPEFTNHVISLLSTKLEREAALRCLEEEKADLILIDGPFFGFRVGLSEIRGREINTAGYRHVRDLADYVRDLSIKLLESGKVIGVLKRVRSSVLDAYMWQRYEDRGRCTGFNDKAILSSIMPAATWFAYEHLLGSPSAYNSYAFFVTALQRHPEKKLGEILEEAEKVHAYFVRENLNCEPKMIETSRYFARPFTEASPFCFEAKPNTSVEAVLEYFDANCNRATGLPFPIDLIDENVSVPEGLTREFMEEVEANLIRDKEMRGVDLGGYFMSINPEKEE